MSLTFGQAKEVLAKYQGKGGKLPTAEQVNLFVRQVLQYLLISGSPNCERKFTLYAVNGYVTAPYELETPLKVRVDGRVGHVVSKWFEFHSGNDLGEKCLEAADVLYEEANEYYTIYDLPAGGAQVGIMGTAEEDCDAHIIIGGDDRTGREIFTNHKGAQIAGERLSIVKNQISWSNVTFANIVSVAKTKTNGYTPLYCRTDNIKGFLADYTPTDEAPTYRRFKLNIPNCPSPSRITVLGRTRIKDKYADTDRIPFDNLYTLEVAAQQVNTQYNKDYQSAAQNDAFVQSLTNREANYKKPNNGQVLDFFYPTSGGTIKGIVG